MFVSNTGDDADRMGRACGRAHEDVLEKRQLHGFRRLLVASQDLVDSEVVFCVVKGTKS